jgi:hypothetical protein
MKLAKTFIAPAIYLFINQYSQATAHYSPIIYLYRKLSVKIHIEAGEIFCILSYFFFSALYLLVSIALTVINSCSAIRFDFRVSRINPGSFGTALKSRCAGHSGFSTLLCYSRFDSTSTMQSSSLSFGLSKSPFQ